MAEPGSLDKGEQIMLFMNESSIMLNCAPVVIGKQELSPKYTKTVFRQLGFTDEEIDAVL